MGVKVQIHTGGVTPICNNCGVSLCWDISVEQYREEQAFWNAWTCDYCNPDYRGALRRWRRENGLPPDFGDEV